MRAADAGVPAALQKDVDCCDGAGLGGTAVAKNLHPAFPTGAYVVTP